MSIYYPEFNELDRKITAILSQDATVTNAVLGEMVGLSSSATNERVRKLKKFGIIKRTVAFVDADFMDMGLCAYVSLALDGVANSATVIDEICEHPNVHECHHMAGEYAYLLKVRVSNTKGMEQFITGFLKEKLNIKKTMTQIVLSSNKEESVVVE
jgi:Lrp/AsnC family leucine-responsive transcriptional regulator